MKSPSFLVFALNGLGRKGLGLCLVVIVGLSGCGSPPLRLSEAVAQSREAGTLLMGEVVRPLTRFEVLARYRPEDLEVAGWQPSSVVDGTAVALTNFKQQQGHFSSAHVYYALVRNEAVGSLETNRTASPRPGIAASYGGDVVSFRIVRPPSIASGPSGVNVVEDLVEARTVSGDCFYEDRGNHCPPNSRHALYSKRLQAQGWVWDRDELIYPPQIADSVP